MLNTAHITVLLCSVFTYSCNHSGFAQGIGLHVTPTVGLYIYNILN